MLETGLQGIFYYLLNFLIQKGGDCRININRNELSMCGSKAEDTDRMIFTFQDQDPVLFSQVTRSKTEPI